MIATRCDALFTIFVETLLHQSAWCSPAEIHLKKLQLFIGDPHKVWWFKGAFPLCGCKFCKATFLHPAHFQEWLLLVFFFLFFLLEGHKIWSLNILKDTQCSYASKTQPRSANLSPLNCSTPLWVTDDQQGTLFPNVPLKSLTPSSFPSNLRSLPPITTDTGGQAGREGVREAEGGGGGSDERSWQYQHPEPHVWKSEVKKKRKGKERKVDVRVSADDNVGGRGGSGSHGSLGLLTS